MGDKRAEIGRQERSLAMDGGTVNTMDASKSALDNRGLTKLTNSRILQLQHGTYR